MIQISHEEEMRRKLENAKEFLKQSTEPTFFTKYSDFIDAVYAEFRSPGDIEYIKEFGKFLEELWEKRNPKPRINVMRIKQKKALNEENNPQEEDEEKRNERTKKLYFIFIFISKHFLCLQLI
jgi:hypothetical protein